MLDMTNPEMSQVTKKAFFELDIKARQASDLKNQLSDITFGFTFPTDKEKLEMAFKLILDTEIILNEMKNIAAFGIVESKNNALPVKTHLPDDPLPYGFIAPDFNTATST